MMMMFIGTETLVTQLVCESSARNRLGGHLATLIHPATALSIWHQLVDPSTKGRSNLRRHPVVLLSARLSLAHHRACLEHLWFGGLGFRVWGLGFGV